jgi:hypothetical protein
MSDEGLGRWRDAEGMWHEGEPPAGWLESADGRWLPPGGPTAPMPPPPPPPPPEAAAQPSPPQGRVRQGMSTRAKVLVGAMAALIVLGVTIIAISGGATEDKTTTLSGRDDETATTARPTTTDEPTTTTTQPEAPPTLAMGETLPFTLTDFDSNETFVKVTVANPATFTKEPIEFGSPPENGLYLVLDVTVEVSPQSEGTYFAGPDEFKFVAADGTAADTAFAMGFDPELPTMDLSAGQRAAGKIVFDINPAQQAGGKVQINDTGENEGEPFAYWRL